MNTLEIRNNKEIYLNGELLKDVIEYKLLRKEGEVARLEVTLLVNIDQDVPELEEWCTYALVQELAQREGVTSQIAAPYEDKTISVNGPATVLTVID